MILASLCFRVILWMEGNYYVQIWFLRAVSQEQCQFRIFGEWRDLWREAFLSRRGGIDFSMEPAIVADRC